MQKFLMSTNQSMEASKDEKSKTNSRCQGKQCGNALMDDEDRNPSSDSSAHYTSCSGIKCRQQSEAFKCHGFKQFIVSEEMKSINMPSLETRKSSSQRDVQGEIIINCSVYQI